MSHFVLYFSKKRFIKRVLQRISSKCNGIELYKKRGGQNSIFNKTASKKVESFFFECVYPASLFETADKKFTRAVRSISSKV